MSEKVKSKIKFNSDTKVTLSVNDFTYLKKVEMVKNSISYYIQQIQGEFLKLKSLELKYKPEQDLTFNIDLDGTSRELTIHELTEKEKQQLASKA